MKAPGLGIDGCKYGWLAVEHHHGGKLNYFLLKDLNLAELDQYKVVFIDMPIGLFSAAHPSPDKMGMRRCDMEARSVLRPYRQHTVFLPPAREALNYKEYEKANKENLNINGKKISQQGFNLSEKIKCIDSQMTRNPSLAQKYVESHPEVLFWLLNKKRVMVYNKKTRDGIRERLYVLQNFVPDISIWTDEVIFASKRRDFEVHDLLDAAALAVGSYYGFNYGLETLPTQPDTDEYGLPMQMALPVIPSEKKEARAKERV